MEPVEKHKRTCALLSRWPYTASAVQNAEPGLADIPSLEFEDMAEEASRTRWEKNGIGGGRRTG
eukprot:gene16356-11689_t